MKKMLLLATLMIFIAHIGFSEGDGSSIDNSVVLKNISNYEKCNTKDDATKEYRKSIEQWLDYVNKRFGQMGVGWEYVDQELVGGEKVEWVDKRTIMLLPSKEKIILYFDISEPFNLFSKELEKYKQMEK